LEHLISLVNDHVFETLQSQDLRTTNKVHKTTRGANDNVTAFLKLSDLIADGAASIHDAGAKHGAVAEAPSLIKDLSRKLTVGTDNKDKRLCTDSRRDAFLIGNRIRSRGSQLLGLTHELGYDWDQKGSSLARTYKLYTLACIIRFERN
jgi:hypothetical protein